ncbi:MAG: hypothetical protein MK085_00395 [Phycisphaerales bacterium]|nr:hypothetical protein [Phycisphaerales bacterium]
MAATWWPLAASWLLMGIEMPLVAAVLSRLENPEVQLAAFGGVVFPMALLIESPVIMLLAASTRLSDSMVNFRYLRNFSRILGISLTAIHALIAFTPLFDILVVPMIDPPEAVIEPARLGFQCMLPFTWAVAERRFHQGLLIRFGRQNQVGIGSVIRVVGTTAVLLTLPMVTSPDAIDGAMIAGLAISIGVIIEAAYARIIAGTVVRGPLRKAGLDSPRLNFSTTLYFYIPLALTSMMSLASQPIGSAGMNRMPLPLESLAIWPAVGGLSFLLRSSGVAFTEVAVRHAGDPRGRKSLFRFALMAGMALSLITILFAVYPLSGAWYRDIEGLPNDVLGLARAATWAMAPLPLFTFLASYWQGILVDAHRTRPVSEGVGVGLASICLVLILLATLDVMPGVVGASLALTIGAATQCAWLAYRANMAPRSA